MAPVRVGFIGLSAKAGWASETHIQYLKDSPKYTITALANSSVQAAQDAIKTYHLPASTKAYGSPEDLAADPNVDLVVCSVRVDKHYDTIKPSVLAGKDCFVEWPLGKNLEQAEELTALANKKGIKTVIGLQGRRSPVVDKVKELIAEGRIGKVLSTTLHISVGFFGDTTPESQKYLSLREYGGNLVTIIFGHMIDSMTATLGELQSFRSTLDTQRPEMKVVGKDGKVTETFTKTTHDQIALQGHFTSGALLSLYMRGGPIFKGEPALAWHIHGQTGEIKVSQSGPFLSMETPDLKVEVHDFETDRLEVIDWRSGVKDAVKDLQNPAQNVGRLYEAFADGNWEGYKDWQHALLRHKLIDEVFKSAEEGREGHYL
ncbi:MAG: hypothetical protein M1819_003027 [Sarea resinae]|nr:MAG: hypothetical protein M1819_003027 [Sarea resinae]